MLFIFFLDLLQPGPLIGHAWPHPVLCNDEMHSERAQLFYSAVDFGGIRSMGCVLTGTMLLDCRRNCSRALTIKIKMFSEME